MKIIEADLDTGTSEIWDIRFTQYPSELGNPSIVHVSSVFVVHTLISESGIIADPTSHIEYGRVYVVEADEYVSLGKGFVWIVFKKISKTRYP